MRTVYLPQNIRRWLLALLSTLLFSVPDAGIRCVGLPGLGGPLPAEAEVSFAPALSFATGSLPWSVALGDVNADGKLDVVAANSQG